MYGLSVLCKSKRVLAAPLGWYAEFLLKIVLQFLLGKIAEILIIKIILKSLHIGLGTAIHCKKTIWELMWELGSHLEAFGWILPIRHF